MLISGKTYLFIQFILMFVLLHFISLCFQYKIFQANLSSIFVNPSEKALLHTYSVKTTHCDEDKNVSQIVDLWCERPESFLSQCLKHGSLSQLS